MIPRQFGRMLMGQGLTEKKPRRPPLPQWIVPMPIVGTPRGHVAQGSFCVVEETPEPRPILTIEAFVDREAAELLAAEAMRLAVPR